MGRYLDILHRSSDARSEFRQPSFVRIDRLFRALQLSFAALERRCPEQVEPQRWQQAVDDGRRFLSRWGEHAAALGWSDDDIFALHAVAPNARYDTMGLSGYWRAGPSWR